MEARFPCRGTDVAVTLSPSQAHHVAGTIRIQLAYAWEGMVAGQLTGQLAGRMELCRFRSIMDLYVDELESLEWGDPVGEVEVILRTSRLEAIARELREGGEESLADPTGRHTPDAHDVYRRGHEMIATATVIDDALAKGRDFAVA